MLHDRGAITERYCFKVVFYDRYGISMETHKRDDGFKFKLYYDWESENWDYKVQKRSFWIPIDKDTIPPDVIKDGQRIISEEVL